MANPRRKLWKRLHAFHRGTIVLVSTEAFCDDVDVSFVFSNADCERKGHLRATWSYPLQRANCLASKKRTVASKTVRDRVLDPVDQRGRSLHLGVSYENVRCKSKQKNSIRYMAIIGNDIKLSGYHNCITFAFRA